jgi:uncharacterized protein (DUF2249 family)
MSTNPLTIDVREDIRAGREPLSKIMAAVSTLKAAERLLVIAPFEPVPLFYALQRHGYSHRAEQKPSGDWEVLFSRASEQQDLRSAAQPPAVACPPSTNSDSTVSPKEFVEIDARGLEPPQPLVRILEAIADLPRNSAIHARTDRRPIHLYPQLENRGFTARTEQQSDGSFLTRIRARQRDSIQ